MDREFTPDRDIPLIAIITAATVLAAWGGLTLISYTPLSGGHFYTLVAATLFPLITCPLGHYLAWQRGKERTGYRVIAVVIVVASGSIGFYHTNGSRDTAPVRLVEARVFDHFSVPGKAGRAYGLRLEILNGPLTGHTARIGISERIWRTVQVDDVLSLRYQPGAWGVVWLDGIDRESLPGESADA